MKTRLAVFAVLGLLLTNALAAQQPLPLTPGQRVCVTAPSAGMHNEVATVGAISADTLVLERRWADQPLRTAVARDSVRVLEISRGKHGYAFVGAALGGILGSIGGAIADHACERSGSNTITISICPFRLVGAVLGVGLGAIVGGARTTDLWEPVPLDRIRVGLAPLPSGRLGLGAAVRF